MTIEWTEYWTKNADGNEEVTIQYDITILQKLFKQKPTKKVFVCYPASVSFINANTGKSCNKQENYLIQQIIQSAEGQNIFEL